MEQTVNERIMHLKKMMRLTEHEFTTRAMISIGTFGNIRLGKEITPKTMEKIIAAFGHREWLSTGSGAVPGASAEQVPPDIVEQLRSEITFLRSIVEKVIPFGATSGMMVNRLQGL